MLTLTTSVADAVNNEKAIAWLLKITLDSTTYYFGSNIPLTLSGTPYVGGFIIQGGVGEIEQGMDILEGGGIDYIGALKITLNNFADEGFVHKYFPPFSSNQWLNRKVEVGIAGPGATASSDVTWLYTGRIDDVNASLSEVVLDVMDWQERFEQDLPKVLINKETYPNAPEESIGLPLPILYGDFVPTKESSANDWSDMYQWTYAPTICINKGQLIFCAAGHVTHTMTTDRAYHRVDGMKAFGIIICGSNYPVTDNDDSGISTIRFSTGNIYAEITLHLGARGIHNTVSDYYNAIDGDGNTSATVAFAGEKYLALTMDGLPNGNMARDTIYIWFENIGTQNYAVGYILPNDSVVNNVGGVQTVSSGEAVTGFYGKSMAEISDYQWLVYCEGAGNVDVIHFGLTIRYTISSIVYQTKAPLQFPIKGGVNIG
jgi:hypothetical protein